MITKEDKDAAERFVQELPDHPVERELLSDKQAIHKSLQRERDKRTKRVKSQLP